jgi:hypothetical protein
MTKTKRNRSGKPLRVTKKGPPKAKRLRAKRKAAKQPRTFKLTVRCAPEVRGKSKPDIRDVEVVEAVGRFCPKCRYSSRPADSAVTWRYWHRGQWRRAKRVLCGKHARQLAKRLEKV